MILKKIDGVDESDYIHANWITGVSDNLSYIASQGPKMSTAADFWRMTIENDVKVVVMLTQVVENFQIKCALYFPDETRPFLKFQVGNDELSVEFVGETEISSECKIYPFEISFQGKKHQLKHYQCLSIPIMPPLPPFTLF